MTVMKEMIKTYIRNGKKSEAKPAPPPPPANI